MCGRRSIGSSQQWRIGRRTQVCESLLCNMWRRGSLARPEGTCLSNSKFILIYQLINLPKKIRLEIHFTQSYSFDVVAVILQLRVLCHLAIANKSSKVIYSEDETSFLKIGRGAIPHGFFR